MDLDLLERLVESARSEGRDALLEPEGLAILAGLGIRVPLHRTVPDPAAAAELDLSSFPGAGVVVKVIAADLPHKTDVGGVRFVDPDRDAVVAEIQSLSSELARFDVRGYLVAERIEYDAGPGGELLLGARWTDDFGPVVTLGAGGVYAELLAESLRPGHEMAIASALGMDEAAAGALIDALPLPRAAVAGVRGREPRADRGELIGAVIALARLAEAAMPLLLAELEINPLVASRDGLCALDVLARCGSEPSPRSRISRPLDKLTRLLEPRSIALVGVSERSVNPGRVILRNVIAAGFPRDRVYIVKSDCASIDGCRCYPDVRSLPEAVDLLVVAVAADPAADVLAEVVEMRRAESVILIPGGMGEKEGGEGVAARVRGIVAASRASDWRGPVINGGNSMGVRSRPGRYDATFIPEHKLPLRGRSYPLAFISQSGAFYAAKLSKLGVDPKHAISLGNQMDLTVGDYLTHLAADEELEVYAVYVEGFEPLDGVRFVDAVREITARGKIVLLYRAGRTREGTRASASHTAAIAGDYEVTRELARRAGAAVCETVEEFDDLLKLSVLLGDRPARGRRLGAMSNAGFECVAIADNTSGLELARLADSTRDRLRALLVDTGVAGIVDVRNPLDVTPMCDDRGYAAALEALLHDDGLDVAVAGCVPLTPALQTLSASDDHDEDASRADAVAARLARVIERIRKPCVLVVDAGPLYQPFVRALESHGIPTFPTVDRALRALGRWCEIRLR